MKIKIKLDYRGRLLIPKFIRKAFNIEPSEELEVIVEENQIIIKKEDK